MDSMANLTAAEFGILMAKALLEIQSSAAWFVFQTAIKEIPDNEDMEYSATEVWLKALIAKAAPPPGDGGLREALEKLSRWREPDSVTGSGDFDRGLLCGVEDHGFQKEGYSAMRFGYDRALERVAEEIDGTIAVALDRPAEISARDEEGGWHDTTLAPAEGQRIMATVKLCTCEIITGGQMVDDPACPFHHAPAPSETGKKPPEDFATRSEGTFAPKRWKCKGCDLVGGEIGEMIVGPDGTLIHWDEERWCGPVEPTGEEVGT